VSSVELPQAGWTPELLDVPAYLARVGVAELPGRTAAGLRDLHRAHVLAIPFENLDVAMGRGVDTSLRAVQAKLVDRRRGGYCYEHNTLFGAVLDRAGFEVTRLGARVRSGADFIRPRTHMLLAVRLDGRLWLADVGFGGDGLLEPIPLEHGTTSRQGAWTYRVVREAGPWHWALQSLRPDGWMDLYGLTLEPQFPIDYVMANYYTSTHPLSGFVRSVTVQHVRPDHRLVLRVPQLTGTAADGTIAERTIDAAELDELLRERFGIALGAEELDLLHARWPAAAASGS
jgi:N-hydroxyarylamine O-acetyltransferase